jgi:hypothetical protein
MKIMKRHQYERTDLPTAAPATEVARTSARVAAIVMNCKSLLQLAYDLAKVNNGIARSACLHYRMDVLEFGCGSLVCVQRIRG